jgi:hypothetical protein
MAALGKHCALAPGPLPGRPGYARARMCIWSTTGATSAPSRNDADMRDLLDAARLPPFDRDSYRILLKALARMMPLVPLAAGV